MGLGKRQKSDTCIAAGELADEYQLARNLEIQEKPQDQQVKKQSPSPPNKWYNYCKTIGHTRDQCRKLQGKREKETQPGDSNKEAFTQKEQGKRPLILENQPYCVTQTQSQLRRV